MKRILLTALTLASITSFAQLKPGPPAGHQGPILSNSSIEIQQIQLDLQSTRLSLQNALATLKTNPKLSANNIQQALMRIDSVSYQVNALDNNTVPEVITGYYVTLKSSSSGKMYAGEGPTRLQATEKAQQACLNATGVNSYCQTIAANMTTDALTTYNTSESVYCSIKSSSSGKNYGAPGRIAAEATLKAQQGCLNATGVNSYCKVSPDTVTCE